tara:strand:+ start:606 stop:1349 length:744 start_codon:yes stop_codon:yes gene_type:complete
MDLVSVIIPYYQKRKFISKTVNSALKQSYKNLEILIIYDDENCVDLNFIEEIKERDSRISIIKNNKNMGAGISRNIGISKSTGKYIAFLDADDIWKSDKLSKQIGFMIKNDYQVSHTSYSIINKDKKITGLRKAKNFFVLGQLLKSCDIGTSTVILKKNLINDHIKFASLSTKEDFVLWLRLLEKKVKIYGLDENLSLWTKSSSSLSSSATQKILDGFRVYYEYMNFNFFKSIYYLICLSINFLIKK